jgi:Domain of unknown function (DUF4332)
LLEAAGVETVPELRQRNAVTLYEKLVRTSEAKKFVRKVPTVDQVAEWVKQAKFLPSNRILVCSQPKKRRISCPKKKRVCSIRPSTH